MTHDHTVQIRQASPTPAAHSIDRVHTSSAPDVLTTVYREDCNLSVWKRALSSDFLAEINQFVRACPDYNAAVSVSPDTVERGLRDSTRGSTLPQVLIEDISELVDMFSCLFEQQRVGLRLAVLTHPMCPRFHVDQVPCRLVTTYTGAATECLPHDRVDRTKLGAGNKGLPDHESGIYHSASDIHHLTAGDVALLKGEGWYGNENAGLVHRSPAPGPGEQRLLLTLDFMA